MTDQIKSSWEEYRNKCVAANASINQTDQLESAFYKGVSAGLRILYEEGEEDINIRIKDIIIELNNYQKRKQRELK